RACGEGRAAPSAIALGGVTSPRARSSGRTGLRESLPLVAIRLRRNHRSAYAYRKYDSSLGSAHKAAVVVDWFSASRYTIGAQATSMGTMDSTWWRGTGHPGGR